ncbi:MAG: ABC transporter permease [Lachnospiraceae bacterium]|nr:ABC transporter permease [Lachnospiraceae bacterium]
MFRLMLQKLLHKKWMVLCLLIGNVLLIATATSYPMYKNASLKRMLDDEMEAYMKENSDCDIMNFFLSSQNGSNVKGYNSMVTKGDSTVKGIGIKVKNKVWHFNLVVSAANSLLARDDVGERQFEIGALSNFENCSNLLSGRYGCDGIGEDGCLEAVVTTDCLVNMNLLIGEELEFGYIKDASGKNIRVKIVGVVDPVREGNTSWVEEDKAFDNELLISYSAFEKIFLGETFAKSYIRCNWFYVFDLGSIEVKKIDHVLNETQAIADTSSLSLKITAPGYLSVLKSFKQTENKIHVTLIILQVPVMALLLAFLFMISGQMLSLEQNEISLLKSRGASKHQIGRLYLLQSTLVDLISCLIGLPIGILMCQLIGSSEAFLEFNFARLLSVKLSGEVWIYALAASAASILVTLIPALKASGLSIVKLKQKKARSSKKLWQKLYLDVIIFGVSVYGYYTFSRQTEDLAKDVMSGKGLDPLLYLSSVLFILGAGMIFLRIQPYVVKLIFAVGKKKWQPAGYASFLQIIRTGTKQQFVMLFLVLTVSLGIYDSTVARTIISNAEDNATYMIADDIVMVEAWKSNILSVQLDPTIELKYVEPDFGKYDNADGIEKAARVFIDNKVTFKHGNSLSVTTLMAVDTKEFGEAVIFDSSLLDKHINHYLNAISQDPDAILCSRSFESLQGYKVGDKLVYTGSDGKSVTGVIKDFVDYWPTFKPTEVRLLNDGTTEEVTNYLVVAHLSTIQSEWGKTPYHIFIRLRDNADKDFFYNFVENNKITLAKYENLADKKEDIRQDTLFQGTNGILTMSFIVILILCLAGYLIYWIMSIKSRELLFGVFRAMGMRKSEIVHMLFNEQLATGIFSIAVGALIGILSSRMFVPMIQLAYAGESQVTPLSLTIYGSDMIRLFSVILVMVIVSIVVLSKIVSSMKITNALKLGED